jgi:hypothetical protein
MTEMRKLLTIVCEAELEPHITAQCLELGAHGYTVTDARGRGSRGERDASWSAAGNVRIEIICEDGVARAIAARLQERYFAHYAMVLYVADVAVLRSGKF